MNSKIDQILPKAMFAGAQDPKSRNPLLNATFKPRMITGRMLINLRWLGIIGQSLTILITYFALGFDLPIILCLVTIAASLCLNLFISIAQNFQKELSEKSNAIQLGFDILQLSILLFLTGGLQNPFAMLLVVPITTAVAVLPTRYGLSLLGLSLGVITTMAYWHYPVPWYAGETLILPRLYSIGVWGALFISVAFAACYAVQVIHENARVNLALVETQKILAQEAQVNALGSLAAAAAHELGTPLSTIQLTAREMVDELQDAPLKADAELILEEAFHCRDILSQIAKQASRTEESATPFVDETTMPLLLEEVVAPYLRGTTISIETSFGGAHASDLPSIALPRKLEIIYALRNFVHNAIKHARSKVTISAILEDDYVEITISDDGGGFAPDILKRLGAPYLGTHPLPLKAAQKEDKAGLGLGFFIAKRLVFSTGGTLHFGNAAALPQEAGSPKQNRGAWVKIRWSLAKLVSKPT